MLDVEIRVYGEVQHRYRGLSVKKAADLFNRGYASGTFAAVCFQDGKRLKIGKCMKLFMTMRAMTYDSLGDVGAIGQALERMG